MGIVNDYIKMIVDKFKNKEKKYEHPWHQYYNNLPEHLNYPEGSMYDRLKETATYNDIRIAYKYFNTQCTYKEFMKKIDSIAESLMQFSVEENEAITLCLPNTPESFALIYAINKIGAIANIVHPLSSQADIERALSEANSDILFFSDSSMQKVKDIKVKQKILVPNNNSFNFLLKLLYNVKEKDNLKIETEMLTWAQFLDYKSDIDPYVKRKGEDPAAIIYSGGTTGKPKGIILSNRNFNSIALQTMKLVPNYVRPGCSVLSALPIFHVFGLAICCHTVLTAGMTCHIIPRINTKHINKEIKKYHPTIFPAVPSMLKLSINDKDPGANAFKNIKLVVVGGDYLPYDLKTNYEKYLKDHGSKAEIKVGYGLSECSGFVCSTAPLKEEYVENGTLGIPNPDIDIKIFEIGNDIEKAPGEIGEICISGPNVMLGYINETEETEKTLIIHHDEKTWLHTGDLGYMDLSGRFYYSSRLKRMIITNGYNIYPIELEEIISRCDLVSSCTVVGVPHKTKGQTPKAVIVLKEGVLENIDTKLAIKKYCRENLARYAVPTEFEFRKALPVTAVGKVAYRQLENKK